MLSGSPVSRPPYLCRPVRPLQRAVARSDGAPSGSRQLDTAERNANAGGRLCSVVNVGGSPGRPLTTSRPNDQPACRMDNRGANSASEGVWCEIPRNPVPKLANPRPRVVALCRNAFFAVSSPDERWKCAPVPVRFENGLAYDGAMAPWARRDLARRHLEQDHVVSRNSGRREVEVDLELAIRSSCRLVA